MPLKSLENLIKNQKTDAFFLILSFLHIPMVTIFSLGYGTWTQAVVGSSLVFGVHFLGYLFYRNTLFLKFLTSLVLLSYSALLIHVQLGRIEMHFHVFGALAFLLLYEEWRIIPIGAVILLCII